MKKFFLIKLNFPIKLTKLVVRLKLKRQNIDTLLNQLIKN